MIKGRTTLVRKEDVKPRWFLVDASDQILGRLATRVATILMGKHRPAYVPYVDTGDFVVVTNARNIKLSGVKADKKTYQRYTGYADGRKVRPYKTMIAKHPEEVIYQAVHGMMPRNRLAAQMLKKLKIYAGNEHPHQSQNPEKLDLFKQVSDGKVK